MQWRPRQISSRAGQMRKYLYGFLGLIILLVAAALIVPGLLDWNRFKGEITSQVQAQTGRNLTIDGDLDLAVLPSPHLSAANVHFANIAGGSVPDMARLKALQVNVRLMPLLAGKVEVASVTLVEPDIVLEKLADGRVNWSLAKPQDGESGERASVPLDGGTQQVPATQAPPGPNATGGTGGGEGFRLDKLRIVNGTLTYRDATTGTVERIEKITADLAAESLSGPFRAKGSLVARGLPLGVTTSIGRLHDEEAVPLSLELAVAKNGNVKFSGSLIEMATTPQVSGKLRGNAADVGKLLAAVQSSQGPAGSLPPFLSQKAGFVADMRASEKGIALDDLTLEFGPTRATGGINVGLGKKVQADIALAINRIELDPILAAEKSAQASAGNATGDAGGTAATPAGPAAEKSFALPADINASLDLRIQAIDYQGGAVRDAKLAASLTDGEVTLSQATARLPGGGTMSLFGFLAARDGRPVYDGTLEARANDLRGVLQWLKVDVDEVPPDRLRQFSLNAKLRGDDRQVQALGVDIRLDSSHVRGGVTLALRERPAFGASVNIDHLNVDAYLPPDRPAKPVPPGSAPVGGQQKPSAPPTGKAKTGSPLAALAAFDANFQARIGNLTVQRMAVREVVFDGTLQNGALTVRRAGVGDLAGVRAQLSGSATALAGKPRFRGNLRLDARSVDGIARLAGVTLGETASAIGAATLTAKGEGSMDAVSLDTVLIAAGLRAGLKGSVSALASAPRIDIALTAEHNDAVALARRFGVMAGSRNGTLGALDLNAKVKGDLTNLAVDTRLGLAGGTAALKGAVANPATKPAIDLTLDFNHPSFARLMAALGTAYRPAGKDEGGVKLAMAIKGTPDKLTLDDISAKAGRATLAGTADLALAAQPMKLTAGLTAGDITVDDFLPARTGPAAPEAAPRPGAAPAPTAPRQGFSHEPLDLSALGSMDADIKMTANSISYQNIKVDQPRLVATLAGKVLTLSELTGKMFDGAFDLKAQLDGKAVPALDGSVKVAKANVGKALFQTANFDIAGGVLDFDAAVKARGASEFALVSALNGAGKLAVRDGTVKGFDLDAVSDRLGNIDKAVDLLGLIGTAMSGGTTKFSSLDGTFNIDKGILRTDDLKLVAASGEGLGKGTVDLPRWRIDMATDFRLTKHPKAPGFGILVQGPLDAPRQTIRAEALQGFLIQRGVGSLLQKVLPKQKAPTEAPLGSGQAPAETQPQQPAAKPDPKDILRGLLKGLGR